MASNEYDNNVTTALSLIDKSSNPLFVFDDDCDGLASFLMLYNHTGKGMPMVIKSSPVLTLRFADIIALLNPDLVVVLDIAMIEENALSIINCPVIWIDHHEPQEPMNTIYINPRNIGYDYPTSLAVYRMINKGLWLCIAGCISDYHYPDNEIEFFRKEYPELLNNKNTIDGIHYDSDMGKIIDILSFSMKGTVKDALSLVKKLSGINNPNALINGEDNYRKLLAHYNNVKKKYDALKEDALLKYNEQSGLLKVFLYDSDKWSLTHELSSELASYYPDNIIIVGRPYDSKYLLSLRSRNIVLRDNLVSAVSMVGGSGGGHPHACGANIPVDSIDDFIRIFGDSF
ncbi:MAG: DHHA1 domain-containing protein [Candidatus Woesearchaeota archaeon]